MGVLAYYAGTPIFVALFLGYGRMKEKIIIVKSKMEPKKLGDQLLTLLVWIIFVPVVFVLGLVIFIIFLPLLTLSTFFIYIVVYLFTRIILLAMGVWRIEIKGIVWKGGGPYIFILNHSSFLDMFLSIYLVTKTIGLRKSFSIIFALKLIKMSLFVPIFYKFLKQCLPISENQNYSQSKKLYFRVLKLVKLGSSLVIFPEGRRILPKDKILGIDLLNFLRGAFILSKATGAKIIPVYIKGAYDFKPRYGQWWFSFRKITFYVGNPINPKGKTVKELVLTGREKLLLLIDESEK